MMPTQKQENMTMRALCLLAIIFVVDGHVPLADLFDLGGLMGYYSFHLMLFAFASGYFFRLHGSVGQDIIHRSRRLLLPLYAWNLVYGFLSAILRHFGGFTLGAELSWYTLLAAPVLDGEHFVYNLGAWYLFALFFTQIVYAALRRCLCRLNLKEEEWVAFAACLAAGMISVFALQKGMGPLFLLRALVLLPGYAGGVLYRERLEKRDTKPTVPMLSFLLVMRALLLFIFGRLTYLLSSGTWLDCGPLGVYLGGAVGIAFWLRIARLLAPSLENSRAARWVSRHTLTVMMHHYMGFFAVNGFFLVLNCLKIGAADFSVRAFRSESGYVYAPGGGAGWTVLYLAAGLLLPMMIGWAGERLVGHFRKDGRNR